MRILIVEDEAALRQALASAFQMQGFTVTTAADGEEGIFAGIEYPIDMAIIDLGLPRMSGLELVKRLREQGKKFPILILTARDRWQDKVEGLGAGADDYVVKPYQIEEIKARVSALLRRSGGWAQPLIRCGEIAMDTRTQEVSVDGNPVELTGYEYRILEMLMLRAGEIISKSELTEKIYEQDFERDSNVIEVLVGRLRRKLDPQGVRQPIETLRGRGYRIALPRP
ncbi:MAG: response regulator transcription factor [Proteobacteria bacterium]|nr:response regulator transcription factor [Pseudomonadota bacterium]